MQKLGDFVDPQTRSDRELESRIVAIHESESVLAAERLAALAEVDRRGPGMEGRVSSAARWFAKGTRITDAAAERLIALGAWLTLWRNVFDALVGGNISEAHAGAIRDGHGVVLIADPTLSREDQEGIVADLLSVASSSTANQVKRRAQQLSLVVAEEARARHRKAEAAAARSRQDRADHPAPVDAPPSPASGPAPDDAPPVPLPPTAAENSALNRLDIFELPNGRSRVNADLDKLTVEKLQSALSPLTAPVPGPNGQRDTRSPSKRRADGLDQILDSHLYGRRTPTQGGSRANVHVTVTLRDLLIRPADAPNGNFGWESSGQETRRGPGAQPSTTITPDDPEWPFNFSWTGPISRSFAELVGCDANLVPVILDDAGVPLAMGRSERLVSAQMRTAVVIRDRCCVKCGRPAQWCQVHHVINWSDGGGTDLINLALLCGECHRQIHNTEWEIAMGDDGHPYTIPPASEDPERKPVPSFHRRRRRAA